MKIAIKDIHPGGIEVSGRIAADILGVTGSDDFKFMHPLDVKAKVGMAESTVWANVSVASEYSSFCCRCLEPISRAWRTGFNLDFTFHSGLEYIEFDEDIRQEVILNLPSRMLCHEDCKGLCAGCGGDLNKEGCTCKVQSQNNAKTHAKQRKGFSVL